MTRSTNAHDDPALQFVYGRDTDYEKDTGIAQILDVLLRENDLFTEDHRFFQMTHITTELTWYAIHFEMRRLVAALETDRFADGVEAIRRACDLLNVCATSLQVFSQNLQQQHFLRFRDRLLPNGSGFDSPGMRNLKKLAKPIWRAFAESCDRHETGVAHLVRRAMRCEHLAPVEQRILELYQLLTTYDMRIMEWRQAHLRIVWKNAGGGWEHCLQLDASVCPDAEVEREPRSVRGRTLEKLTRSIVRPMFPELWQISERVFRAPAS
jgi:tryptophan 2,3-dioxygenase